MMDTTPASEQVSSSQPIFGDPPVLSVRTDNVVGSLSESFDESRGPISDNPENDSQQGPVENEDEDDDNLTVIVLDHADDGQEQPGATDWLEQTGPELEERRRNVLIRELRRVQRSSFLHFALLCLIPTALLVIVIATVVGEDQECPNDVTYCELEPRSFVNAFTTRCICDPIPVDRSGVN